MTYAAMHLKYHTVAFIPMYVDSLSVFSSNRSVFFSFNLPRLPVCFPGAKLTTEE